jgi:membrane protein YqaA with SNARE-associated domain
MTYLRAIRDALLVQPAPADADGPTARRLHRLRLWFGVYLAWMIALFTLALVTFTRYEAGDPAALAPWLLALTLFYVSLCNTLVPLPTSWVFLLLASEDVMLFESAWLRVAAVAILGSTATMMANLNEYHVFGYFLRAKLGDRIRRTHVYRWAIRWFDLSPFRTLMLIAFVPVPVDFVRWLAILRRYPRWRFAAAYWLGRLPRYAMLAGVSVALRLSTWEIIVIQVGIVAVLGARLMWTAMHRSGESTAPVEETA